MHPIYKDLNNRIWRAAQNNQEKLTQQLVEYFSTRLKGRRLEGIVILRKANMVVENGNELVLTLILSQGGQEKSNVQRWTVDQILSYQKPMTKLFDKALKALLDEMGVYG